MRRVLQFAVLFVVLVPSAQATTKLFLKRQFNSGPSLTTYQYASLTSSVLALTTAVTTKINGTTQDTVTAGGSTVQWVSPPLSASATISGTISYDAWVKTSSTTGAPKTVGRLYRLSGGVETQISTKTSALTQSTSIQHDSFTDTAPTSTALAIGDRLVEKLFVASTSATGTETVDYGGLTAAADGDTWVQTTENLSFSAEPEFIQYVAGGPTTATLPGVSATGNLITCWATWGDRTNTVTLTDTKSNTHTPIASAQDWSSASRMQMYYAKNITGGGAAVVVTAAYSVASTNAQDLYCTEYAGLDTSAPLDKNSSNSGSSTAVDSGTQTTTATNDLIVGYAKTQFNNALTPGTGLVDRDPANHDRLADRYVTSTGTYSANWTVSTQDWGATMGIFKSAVQPAGVTVVPKMTLLGVGP